MDKCPSTQTALLARAKDKYCDTSTRDDGFAEYPEPWARVLSVNIPEGLCPLGRRAAEVIAAKAAQYEADGGSNTLYTPDQWRAQGEDLDSSAVLVVTYDGGDVGIILDYEHCCPGGGPAKAYAPISDTAAALKSIGALAQPVNHWYTEVYPL
jgi:hypothetical protein